MQSRPRRSESSEGEVEPQELARACAAAMWETDRASRAAGMQVEVVSPGHATLSMTVREDMVNAHDLCHGGLIFTLADSAFAYACNSYDQATVSQHCDITFLAAAHLGDRLIARAIERSRTGRSGLYDVTVTRADGTVIAEFRGNSRTIGGSTTGRTLPGA